MSTDKLIQFTETELEIWKYFVNFQDLHTHSALTSDSNSNIAGCTIPDSMNISYVVLESGEIISTKCQQPEYNVRNETAWKSLDEALMSIYNCEPINDCNVSTEMQPVETC